MTTPRAAQFTRTQEATLRLPFALAMIATLLSFAAPSSGGSLSARKYTMTLAATEYGWTGAQHRALDELVGPESGWNPCRRYPSTTDCAYAGSNSCGIPQATPCPSAWRGRLASSWREQVRWLLSYIERRYHDPVSASAFRRSHNWY